MSRSKPKGITIGKKAKIEEPYGLSEDKVYRTKFTGPEYDRLKQQANRVDLRRKLSLLGYDDKTLDGMTTREMMRKVEDES